MIFSFKKSSKSIRTQFFRCKKIRWIQLWYSFLRFMGYLMSFLHFPFLYQYFDFLPLKISSICLHSILKMISATRRIFFVFLLIFCHQYFDCLPPKIWSYRNVIFSPGILSMRSIFLQGFQGLKRFILMSCLRYNTDLLTFF